MPPSALRPFGVRTTKAPTGCSDGACQKGEGVRRVKGALIMRLALKRIQGLAKPRLDQGERVDQVPHSDLPKRLSHGEPSGYLFANAARKANAR